MAEKLKYMESRRRWNSLANEKQFLHQVRLKQLLVEDVRKQLEDHFGSRKDVPEKIEEAIKIGEKEIDERVKMLKMADKASWLAVDKYVADPLCDNDEDDRSGSRQLKRQKRSSLRRGVVVQGIITGIEAETGIDLAVGTMEGETAGIGSRIGM